MIEQFGNGAFKAKTAGYDMVEIHAAHGFLQIGQGVADAAQQFQVVFGMLHFVKGRLFENLGNVVVAFFPGDFGKKGILVAGLGFTGKCVS